jgi:elongator complex protein 1
LYEEALQIYNQAQSPNRNIIAQDYADYLFSKSSFIEAGLSTSLGFFLLTNIVYNECLELPKALQSFKLGGDWKMALLIAAKLNYDEKSTLTLAYELVDSLMATSQYNQASQILIDYCNDVEQAVVTLLQGSEWQEALRRVRVTCLF